MIRNAQNVTVHIECGKWKRTTFENRFCSVIDEHLYSILTGVRMNIIRCTVNLECSSLANNELSWWICVNIRKLFEIYLICIKLATKSAFCLLIFRHIFAILLEIQLIYFKRNGWKELKTGIHQVFEWSRFTGDRPFHSFVHTSNLSKDSFRHLN